MAWIGAAISVAGSLLQSDSASQASGYQDAATAAAVAEQKRQYDQTRKDTAPWRDTGSAAQKRLAVLLGLQPTASGRPGSTGYTPQDFIDYSRRAGTEPGESPEAMGARLYGWYKNGGGNSGYDDDAAVSRWIGKAPNPQAPTPDAGYGDLNKKFTLADFFEDPVIKASYQSGLDLGTKALDNMAGARGNRNSGAQLKALDRFATDYTGQKAGESYNRFYGDQDRTFNRLAGVSGTGQTAATSTASLGTGSANTISGLLSAQGNARGAAAIAGGNAMGGALSNIAGNYNQQQTLNQILNRGSGGYGASGSYGGGYQYNPAQFGGGDAWQ